MMLYHLCLMSNRGSGVPDEDSYETLLERQLEGELNMEELMKHRAEPENACMVRDNAAPSQ